MSKQRVSVSVSSFASTFEGNPNVIGTVPTLWENFPTANGTSCFIDAKNTSNYNIVPLNWGGSVRKMSNNMVHGVVVQSINYIPKITIDLTTHTK